jgi:hypothetical protein
MNSDVDECDDDFFDVSELSIDSNGIVIFDETRVKKRRDGPSIDVIIKKWYDKYVKFKCD